MNGPASSSSSFSPLSDRSICRYIIANAQNLVRITRGRHMVLVSEAEQETQLRSPHDVANLAHIFGLNHEVIENSTTVTVCWPSSVG